MLNLCLGATVEILLFGFFLSHYEFRRNPVRLAFVVPVDPRMHRMTRSMICSGDARAAHEFAGHAFEDAIAAYEELIDSTCSEQIPKHAALVVPRLDRIGAPEWHVILLARELVQRGWRITVVVLAGRGGPAELEVTGAGAQYLNLAMRCGLADPRGWLRFILWLRRGKPDVVHAHLHQAAWLARWSRLFASVPIVIDTLHSTPADTLGRRLGYRISRWLPDQVIAVSASVAESHVTASAVSEDTLTVLHNGVDLNDWRPDRQMRASLRRQMGLNTGVEMGIETGVEDQFLWVAVGRLEMAKDYPTLLKAMAALPRSARLVIAGDGPLRRNLSWLSSSLGLAGRVRFLGHEPNVKRWLQAADGFVLTSRWEGLPAALLEAAACELPAVATDVPGIREVIEDGETGMLVPAMDAAALACAMTAIMRLTPQQRRAVGARARNSIAERFSLASAIDGYEKLLDDLLMKKCRAVSSDGATAGETRCAEAAGNTSVP